MHKLNRGIGVFVLAACIDQSWAGEIVALKCSIQDTWFDYMLSLVEKPLMSKSEMIADAKKRGFYEVDVMFERPTEPLSAGVAVGIGMLDQQQYGYKITEERVMFMNANKPGFPEVYIDRYTGILHRYIAKLDVVYDCVSNARKF